MERSRKPWRPPIGTGGPPRPGLRPSCTSLRTSSSSASATAVRVPSDGRRSCLVPALRGHVQLGDRLHGQPGLWATSTSPWSSGCSSSSHVPARLDLRALTPTEARPAGARARAAVRRETARQQGGPGMSSDTLTALLFLAVVAGHGRHHVLGQPAEHAAPLTSTPAAATSPGFQNGMAISGDYMSAASFLGISGAIAPSGYDGFLYSIGFLVAWLVALLLVAELLRNSGPLHDGRPARLPDAPDPGPHRRGDVHGRRLDLLPARPDGRRRCARRAAARCRVRGHQGAHHRRGRPADDLLRHRRRHEGHDLGADRQGGAADERHGPDHGAGARGVQLQPLRPARRGGQTTPARARRSSSPG